MQGPYIVSFRRADQSKPLKKGCCLILSKVVALRCLGCLIRRELMRLLAFQSFMNLGKVTLCFLIAVQTAYGSPEAFSPKGSPQHRNSQSKHPKDQRSTSKEYPFPSNTSGAIQCGVPIMVKVLKKVSLVSSLAVPMSIRYTFPRQSITEFSGFRSRQTILLECRHSTDTMRQAKQYLTMSRVIVLIQRMTSNISLPWMYSISRKTQFLSWKAFTKPTIQGKIVFSRICFSWRTLDSISSLRIYSLERHLMAQRLVPYCMFLTRKTCPNCPSPNFFRYWKSFRQILFLGAVFFLLYNFAIFFLLLRFSSRAYAFLKARKQQVPSQFFTSLLALQVLLAHPSSLNTQPSCVLLILPSRQMMNPGQASGSMEALSFTKKCVNSVMNWLMSVGERFLKTDDRMSAHFLVLQCFRLVKDAPREFQMSLRLIMEHTTRVMAVAVPDRFIPYSKEASPNIQPAFRRMSCFPQIWMRMLPQEIIYRVCASSPARKITSSGWKATTLTVLARRCFCLFVKEENMGTARMASAFLAYSSNFIFCRDFRQSAGFMIRNSQLRVWHAMEALLAAFKSRAISPKELPFYNSRTNWPSISTCTLPLQMRKKQLPISPCWKTYLPSCDFAQIIS